MTLNEWQERLQLHFGELRNQRAQVGEQGVVYALEHGLDESEVSALSEGIRTFIRNSQPSDRHWLPWIVYSAEIGYEYSGDEYWATFAHRTPGWNESGADRSWIRSAFSRFHREYNGAQPTGRWAEHFSIICWPITHAILPRDLQRQLAELLFDIRHAFTAQLLDSPERLGEQIEAHSWRASSRFRDLAGEHLLLGQIATALLLTGAEKEAALILPSTLRRIAGDLDRNRRSREWLRDAQQRAATVRLTGLRRGLSEEELPLDTEEPEAESAHRRAVVALGVEPELMLRQIDAQTWDIRLNLPDLSRLLSAFPQFKQILANERCTVAGAKGGPLARGFLLYGNQEVSLANWPNPSEVLIKFENSDQQLDFLLTTECLLRPGPRWLFKIVSDGSAVEIRSHIIQPGNSYIILARTSTGLTAAQLQCTPVKTRCAGVLAARVDVPVMLSHSYSELLQNLGLQPSSGLQVKPVGLPAAKWDDQGYAEWLSSDSPAISISSDFEMNGIALNLVGLAGAQSPGKLELSGAEIKPHVFVELGQLDPGRYRLYVIAGRPSESRPLIHGTMNITIRPAKAWRSDVPRATPFSVFVSPATPYIEQLWDGSATLEIQGPKFRKAECEIRFCKDLAGGPSYVQRLPSVDLPCTTDTWATAFDQARGDTRIQNAYDESLACVIEIRCEELGQFALHCEREPTPLRWVLKQENQGYALRLAQLDAQQSVSILNYAFESPDRFTTVSGDCSTPFRVPPEGGLYAASTSNFRSAIVVPPRIQSFAQLGLRIQFLSRQRTEEDTSQLLNVMELWSSARVTGDPISRNRKRQILCSLENQLSRVLCGDIWARLERGPLNTPEHFLDIKNAVSSSVRHLGIGTSLLAKRAELPQFGTRDVYQYLNGLATTYLDLPALSIARDHGISRQAWIVEFAYRLVSEPEHIREWAQLDFLTGLHYVLRNPVLCRMARLANLLHAAASEVNAYKAPAGEL
jgi:hypothetical protein